MQCMYFPENCFSLQQNVFSGYKIFVPESLNAVQCKCTYSLHFGTKLTNHMLFSHNNECIFEVITTKSLQEGKKLNVAEK